MIKYIHKCIKCGAKNHRYTNHINPDKFTDPKSASVTAVYWCCLCGRLNGIKYAFKNEREVQITQSFEPKPSQSKSKLDPTRDFEALPGNPGEIELDSSEESDDFIDLPIT